MLDLIGKKKKKKEEFSYYYLTSKYSKAKLEPVENV